MKHPVILAALLIATILVAAVSIAEAKRIQDSKRLDDFSNRPAPPVSVEAAREMEKRLDEARARYEANPNDPDAIIWFGRRLAYPGRFREAIDVYSKGIEKFPDDARFYRHRGHRYITLRRFALAIEDLRKAAENPTKLSLMASPTLAISPRAPCSSTSGTTWGSPITSVARTSRRLAVTASASESQIIRMHWSPPATGSI